MNIVKAVIPRNYYNININYREDDESDTLVIREMFVENVYRVEGWKLEQENAIVLDIGANIGVFSLQMLKIAQETNHVVTIYAVEPEEENLVLLKKNIEDNPKLFENGSKVIIVEKGISDFHGKAKITHQSGGSRVKEDGVQEIDVITYDEFIEEYGIDKVDFLKIDIEGSEVPLIAAASYENIQKVHFAAIEFDTQNKAEDFLVLVKPFLDNYSLSTLGIPGDGCNLLGENHYWNRVRE